MDLSTGPESPSLQVSGLWTQIQKSLKTFRSYTWTIKTWSSCFGSKFRLFGQKFCFLPAFNKILEPPSGPVWPSEAQVYQTLSPSPWWVQSCTPADRASSLLSSSPAGWRMFQDVSGSVSKSCRLSIFSMSMWVLLLSYLGMKQLFPHRNTSLMMSWVDTSSSMLRNTAIRWADTYFGCLKSYEETKKPKVWTLTPNTL